MTAPARAVTLLLLTGACSANRLVLEYARDRPIDALIVPGCPATDAGALSPCLERRVAWAAHLWELGLTRAFITSGAATYNRVTEAVALAAGLNALGVPADRIWLERDARHTDENMFYSLLLGRSLGFQSIGVASEAGQAKGGCSFIESWGESCVPADMEFSVVAASLDTPAVARALADVRVTPVPAGEWLKVDAWEERRAANGGPSRPGSLTLYFVKAPWARLTGDPWYPPDPPERPPLTYAAYLEAQPPPSPAGAVHHGAAEPSRTSDQAP